MKSIAAASAALLLHLSFSLTTVAAETKPAVLATSGVVSAGGLSEQFMWISVSGEAAHYVVEFTSAADGDALFVPMKQSSETGRSVTLRFRLDNAYIDAEGNPTYSVESFDYMDKNWSGFKPHAPPPTLKTSAEENALARGIALRAADRPAAALPELDRSLAGDKLRAAVLALAYGTRGDVLDELAYFSSTKINDTGDAMLVRALADYRRATELDRKDPERLFDLAYTYRELGAPEEAFAIYDEIERRWSDESYRIAVSRGATHRQMGRYEAALRSLDDFIAANGPQPGMKIHYHRAMTLNKLQRHAEAVEEVTTGLRDQPDYLWAFVERACGYAQQGKIPEAVIDQKQALSFYLDADPSLRTSAASQAVRSKLESVLAALEKAALSAPTAASDAACDDYTFNPGEDPRPRSKLLPKKPMSQQPVVARGTRRHTTLAGI